MEASLIFLRISSIYLSRFDVEGYCSLLKILGFSPYSLIFVTAAWLRLVVSPTSWDLWELPASCSEDDEKLFCLLLCLFTLMKDGVPCILALWDSDEEVFSFLPFKRRLCSPLLCSHCWALEILFTASRLSSSSTKEGCLICFLFVGWYRCSCSVCLSVTDPCGASIMNYVKSNSKVLAHSVVWDAGNYLAEFRGKLGLSWFSSDNWISLLAIW